MFGPIFLTPLTPTQYISISKNIEKLKEHVVPCTIDPYNPLQLITVQVINYINLSHHESK